MRSAVSEQEERKDHPLHLFQSQHNSPRSMNTPSFRCSKGGVSRSSAHHVGGAPHQRTPLAITEYPHVIIELGLLSPRSGIGDGDAYVS